MRIDLSTLSPCARAGIQAVVLFYDCVYTHRSGRKMLPRRGLDPDSVRALANQLEKGEELELNEPQLVALCRLVQILLRALEEDGQGVLRNKLVDVRPELSAFLLRIAGLNFVSA